VEAAYAKSILFDYGYRYFYEDGYGKDYRIFNLPADLQRHQYAEGRITLEEALNNADSKTNLEAKINFG